MTTKRKEGGQGPTEGQAPVHFTQIYGHRIEMQHTYIFLTKKIAIAGSKELCCIAWMKNRGHMAIGGDEGSLRVLQLPHEGGLSVIWKATRPAVSPLLLLPNCPMSSAKVSLACWNEVFQKLATCDDAGLIIVWMSHATEDTWFEEMINNRQKSSVVSLKWSNNGTKIAIAYEDGQVIVGSVDGNRLWSKDIATQLTCLSWTSSDAILLLGMIDGEVHGFDMNGNFAFKVPMMIVESVEIETALAKDMKKDIIVCMEWFVSTPQCQVSEIRPGNGTAGTMLPRVIKQDTFAPRTDDLSGRGARRSAALCGRLPARRDPNDEERDGHQYSPPFLLISSIDMFAGPVVCRLAQTVIVSCAWSPDGSILAVAGFQTDLPEDERNVVHFLTPYGAVAFVQSNPSIASSPAEDPNDEAVDGPNGGGRMFYETKMDDYFKRQTAEVWQLESYDDYCIVISQFKMEICDSIGTPVDSTHFNIQPFHIAINSTSVIVASTDSFLVWHYSIPRRSALDGHTKPAAKGAEIPVFHVDDFRNQRNSEGGGGSAKRNRAPFDNICSVCLGSEFILVGRDSGSVHRYSLPDLKLQQRYQLSYAAEHMALNSTNKRLAFITKHHVLKFFDFHQENALTVVPNFERRDVWNEDSLVCMEKQKVVVIHGTDCDDPIPNTGYLCAFAGLTVRCAQLDDVLRDPEHPVKSALVDIETKTLRQAKELLDADKMAEANAFIEANSHPKLWDLLATHALNRLDMKAAEQAFVKLQDYGGLQFLKKLQNIKSESLKKAEVCTFLGDLDTAEHIYFENDRRDLAIDMRIKMHDYFRVLQILQTSSGPGDDSLLQKRATGGSVDRELSSGKAPPNTTRTGRTTEELVKCYLMMDDYARLEALSQQLPDGHEVLRLLAEIFINSGLCTQAVECYLRLNMVNEALDTLHPPQSVGQGGRIDGEVPLGERERSLESLHAGTDRKQRKDACRCPIAKEELQRQAPPLRLKKLFVMGGLLIEQHREHHKAQIAKSSGTSSAATIALQELLTEEHNMSIEDTRLIDTAWRGAEAIHFYMLAHRQLYENKYDAAMRTALVLTDYEEFLPPPGQLPSPPVRGVQPGVHEDRVAAELAARRDGAILRVGAEDLPQVSAPNRPDVDQRRRSQESTERHEAHARRVLQLQLDGVGLRDLVLQSRSAA
ncbi:WD repeat-containing protein 35 [Aphelenchoides fujianensis]|nr:WD repeat-containing protein 35 [Aphelenchoides fujianensis]